MNVEELRGLGENVGQEAGETGLRWEEPDLKIAVKRVSLVGRGDLAPDFAKFPLDDIGVKSSFTLHMVEEEPQREGGDKGLGLGHNECVIICTGTGDKAFNLLEELGDKD